jgi:hypothetical protein
MATRSRPKTQATTKSRPQARRAAPKPAAKPRAATAARPKAAARPKKPAAAPAPEPAAAPAPKTRGMVERAGGAQIRRITAYLPPELAKRLALFALEHDLDKNRVVVQAIEAHLDAQQAGR